MANSVRLTGTDLMHVLNAFDVELMVRTLIPVIQLTTGRLGACGEFQDTF
jgi:hypothetical protein